MLKIAVTGNMGSGKTSVCKVFNVLGIPIFYADKEAKRLYEDPGILKQLTTRLGNHILNTDGKINTQALAEIIFKDQSAMKYVSSIIHPRVGILYDQWALRQINAPYCIQESALVFETQTHEKFDKIILVYAPEEMLLERVTKRDGSDKKQALRRLHYQWEQDKKRSLSHYSILNDNQSMIIPQILDIHKELIKISTS